MKKSKATDQQIALVPQQAEGGTPVEGVPQASGSVRNLAGVGRHRRRCSIARMGSISPPTPATV